MEMMRARSICIVLVFISSKKCLDGRHVEALANPDIKLQYVRGNQHTVMSEITLKVASKAMYLAHSFRCLFFIFSDSEK
jgi:hypothetical protein